MMTLDLGRRNTACHFHSICQPLLVYWQTSKNIKNKTWLLFSSPASLSNTYLPPIIIWLETLASRKCDFIDMSQKARTVTRIFWGLITLPGSCIHLHSQYAIILVGRKKCIQMVKIFNSKGNLYSCHENLQKLNYTQLAMLVQYQKPADIW